jgi:hypothetical protein
MSLIPKFAEYAAAFEKAFESDDWSVVEPFFDEEAVYEIGAPLLGATRCEDRKAILAWFPDVLDRFDRLFDRRELTLLDGPKEENGEVWIRGSATYRKEGLPDFVLVLEETVRFKDGRIIHLEDTYTDAMIAETDAYLRAHGAQLGFEFPEN